MTPQHLKTISILTGSLFVAGCQTPLPVIPHAINCEVNAELLDGKCAAPKPVPNTSTYSSLVDTMQADRKSLRDCSIAADALRDAIRRCNQATDEYNKKIDVLNTRK
jgi:hypothetical protein